VRPRTQGREVAFKVLYQLDLRPDLSEGEVEEALRAESKSAEALKFARELVKGARDHRAEIDRQVEGITHNWRLDRMAAVDRNIIRLGAFELGWRPDVPTAVAINEAVVMAKKYSTKESGSFVNGILDKLAQRHAAPRTKAPVAAEEPGAEDEADDASGEDEEA
jgi:transcription antitermination protein NusB